MDETYPQDSIGGCLLFFVFKVSKNANVIQNNFVSSYIYYEYKKAKYNTGLKFADNVVKNASF
jgi:hypothetical protein